MENLKELLPKFPAPVKKVVEEIIRGKEKGYILSYTTSLRGEKVIEKQLCYSPSGASFYLYSITCPFSKHINLGDCDCDALGHDYGAVIDISIAHALGLIMGQLIQEGKT